MGLRQPGGLRRLHVDQGGAAQGRLPVRSQDVRREEIGQKGEATKDDAQSTNSTKVVHGEITYNFIVFQGGKNEKSKLNQEWNKISAIIDKRKGGGGGSGAKRAKMDD